jgi:hypothetical protein
MSPKLTHISGGRFDDREIISELAKTGIAVEAQKPANDARSVAMVQREFLVLVSRIFRSANGAFTALFLEQDRIHCVSEVGRQGRYVGTSATGVVPDGAVFAPAVPSVELRLARAKIFKRPDLLTGVAVLHACGCGESAGAILAIAVKTLAFARLAIPRQAVALLLVLVELARGLRSAACWASFLRLWRLFQRFTTIRSCMEHITDTSVFARS